MKTRLAILLILTAMALQATEAGASVDIQFGSVDMQEGKVLVNFAVNGYQRNEIVEAIRRGMEVKLMLYVRVIRAPAVILRSGSILYDRSIIRMVKYDFWNKGFVVSEGLKKNVFQSDNAMLEYFFTVKDRELENFSAARGMKYSLRVKAELHSVDLYFPMNIIFRYLVGFWDFNTGWERGPDIAAEE
jgi:hypothetical protein